MQIGKEVCRQTSNKACNQIRKYANERRVGKQVI